MNPSLYQSQSQAALTDITTGNNVVPDSGYPGGLYVAGQGYDLTTGLGTPKASRLVESLCGAVPAGTGSTFTPIAPVRVLDTRVPIGVPTATRLGPGQHLSVQIAGANNVPASGVTAAILNITATNGTASSFLTAYPDGTATPLASNVNFVAGQTIPNLVTVPVGANGKVDIFNLTGSVDVIADLSGYYTTSGSGFKFHASPPHRLFDTRSGAGVASGQVTPVGAGVFGLPLTDVNGSGNAGPLGGAAALVLNVTVTGPTANSFVTVYPSGVARPPSSNLNFTAGETIPNAVVTPVNGSSIDFFNLTGNVNLIADISGYFATN
jgi:hypothetical protein